MLAKRIHGGSHAPVVKMAGVLVRTGCQTEISVNNLGETVRNSTVCQDSRPSQPSKKNLSHICEALNQKVQTAFMYGKVWKAEYRNLHVLVAETAFSETKITKHHRRKLWLFFWYQYRSTDTVLLFHFHPTLSLLMILSVNICLSYWAWSTSFYVKAQHRDLLTRTPHFWSYIATLSKRYVVDIGRATSIKGNIPFKCCRKIKN